MFFFIAEIGWEERLRSELFCVEWDVKYHSIHFSLTSWSVHSDYAVSTVIAVYLCRNLAATDIINVIR